MAHLPLDPTSAGMVSLGFEFGMNARAAIAAMAVAMSLLDILQQTSIGHGPGAFRARPPSIVARRRDAEHAAHDLDRIVRTAILDEAEPHVRGPAKIAIDFLKCRTPSAAVRFPAAIAQSRQPGSPTAPPLAVG
jgi:hypothetical protein